jgi:hypothetical protein
MPDYLEERLGRQVSGQIDFRGKFWSPYNPQWRSETMDAAAEPDLPYNTSQKNVAGVFDSDLASDYWNRDQGVRAITRVNEGSWKHSDTTGQAGLGLEHWRRLLNDQTPTLGEQDERRRIVAKNLDIEDWRSQVRDAADVSYTFQSLESADVPLPDDLEIHQNRLLQGQVYYSSKFRNNATTADIHLLARPRHWNDAPSFPEATDTTHQPLTANEACMKWKQLSDAMSVASRAATCGSRRRTPNDPHYEEPGIFDFERNDFVYKVPSDQDETKIPQSFFDQGLGRLDRLDRLANIVRMKRGIDGQVQGSSNLPEQARDELRSSQGDPGSLSVSSLSHRESAPGINTAFAAMTDEDEETEDFIMSDLTKEQIVPSFEGFQEHIRLLNPGMDSQHGWLIKRIADHQEVRLKHLLDLRIKHPQAILSGSCPSGHLCLASVAESTSKGKVEQILSEGLKVEADLSDNNSNSGDVTEGTFPAGVPMPPVRNFPVEFECNTCFKAKKFQIPIVSISIPQGSLGFFKVFSYMVRISNFVRGTLSGAVPPNKRKAN